MDWLLDLKDDTAHLIVFVGREAPLRRTYELPVDLVCAMRPGFWRGEQIVVSVDFVVIATHGDHRADKRNLSTVQVPRRHFGYSNRAGEARLDETNHQCSADNHSLHRS